ncbi:MAG TPA: MlaD family protein [Thermoleophilaceae bacterium]|nr:MlaD family protein [Thermoleophilaceae bacterium]
MRRLLATLGVAGAVVGAFVLTGAEDEGTQGKTYEIVFDNAFGLVDGGDLKIGGVIAGRTTSFDLDRKPPYHVVVTAEVTKPGFASLRDDARCDVRQQSLIGEYFIDCDIGKSKNLLPDGGRVPVERTSSTIPLDLINNIMRKPYRERFRLILSELGTGLAGRPEELNEVIRRAHPALRETNEVIKILADQNRTIRDFIEDADTVSAEVEPFREDVARWAIESQQTASIQASRSEDLGRYWNRLHVFLDELEPTMAQLEETTNRQIPTLRQLRRAAPDLERFLASAGPFARSSRQSIASLADAATTGRRALKVSQEEVSELRALSEDVPKIAKPLRQFLQAIDDRGRSYENDPEAALRAPPAPDKTAYREGQGYTGIENLMNYIYWQTLGLNAYDEVGHLLRIGLLQAGPCAPYSARPTKELIEKCASWTGPFQPGVDGQPDPTATPQQAAKVRRQAQEVEERAGDEPAQEGPGGPLATEPKPGERDLSVPEVVLPGAVQDLVDQLTEGLSGGGLAPGVELPNDRRGQEALLDYLLAR